MKKSFETRGEGSMDWAVSVSLGLHPRFNGWMRASMVVMEGMDYILAGLFTESIANCKKYIEPVFLANEDHGLSKRYVPGKGWEMFIFWPGQEFISPSFGKTEAEAYCYLLLGLKKEQRVKH